MEYIVESTKTNAGTRKLARMEEVESARKEQEKLSGAGESKEKLSKKMF